VDFNSTTDSLLGAIPAFVIFCAKEERYPLERSTDDRCFFSPVFIDGLVTRRIARLNDISQRRTLLIEGGVNHTLGTGRIDQNAPFTASLRDINGAMQSVDLVA